jgi:serine/threonine protein kinase
MNPAKKHLEVARSTLCIGKPICDYRLQRFRGRGGFGSVWEAIKCDGTIVALKFLPCGDSLLAAQEIRSIQNIRELDHPNLAQVHQVWAYRGYVVATMDLADGSLLDLLDAFQLEYGTPLVSHDICQYLTQVARGLDFLNSRRHAIDGQEVAIQHCDVKPSNLLLYGECVKLTDFGLASVTAAPLKSHRRAGTLAYAAPEVFRGRLSDWTDQYALAVSYCQLRSGRLPFPDTPRSFRKDYIRPAPDLSMLGPEERRIIGRALANVPQERWPSCGELMAQLTRLLV